MNGFLLASSCLRMENVQTSKGILLTILWCPQFDLDAGHDILLLLFFFFFPFMPPQAVSKQRLR